MLGRKSPAKERCDKAGRGSDKNHGYGGGMKMENEGKPNLAIAPWYADSCMMVLTWQRALVSNRNQTRSFLESIFIL